jgi:hypothetical protein
MVVCSAVLMFEGEMDGNFIDITAAEDNKTVDRLESIMQLNYI